MDLKSSLMNINELLFSQTLMYMYWQTINAVIEDDKIGIGPDIDKIRRQFI